MTKDDTPARTRGMSTAAYSADERALLRAVADLVAADRRMRAHLGTRMQMNLHDLQALRHVISESRRGDLTTPRRLADELGISSASTSILVDRLVAQGHLRREPHPTDRRSKVLLPTDSALREVHDELGRVHDRMREVTASVPEAARPAVVEYLRGLAEVMREETRPA